MRSLSCVFVAVVAQFAAAQFINPPSNAGQKAGDYSHDTIYTLGSSVNITWFTSCPIIGLGLWQDGLNRVDSISCKFSYPEPDQSLTNSSFNDLASKSNTGFYNWDPITTPFDLNNGQAFFFVLYNNTGDTVSILFSSHYFNLTSGVSKPTQISSTTTSTTTTTSSTSSTTSSTSMTSSSLAVAVSTVIATVTPSASASSAAKTSDSTGLSTGAKVGLGAGIGVGVPVLAAIAVSLFLLGKKHRQPNSETSAYGGQVVKNRQKPPLGSHYPYNPALIHELPHNTQRESQPLPHPTYELPNNSR